MIQVASRKIKVRQERRSRIFWVLLFFWFSHGLVGRVLCFLQMTKTLKRGNPEVGQFTNSMQMRKRGRVMDEGTGEGDTTGQTVKGLSAR